MKKLSLCIITIAILTSVTAVGQSMTQKDSVAYVSGVLATAQIQKQLEQMGADSAMSHETLINAFKEVFSAPKKTEAKTGQLMVYVSGSQLAQQVRTYIDSTLNVEVMLAGITDAWTKKTTIESEEASNLIMAYLDTMAKVKSAAYLAKVDSIPNIQKSETGLRYIISERGEGQVGKYDTVVVDYTLTDMDGKEFQTTIGQHPLKVAMPNGTIAGFTEGLQLLGKGGKATIYVPSNLGYGSALQHKFGGQVLTFEIQIVDILPYIQTPSKENYEELENEDYEEYQEPQYSKKELREIKKLRELLEKYPDYSQEY